MTDYLERKSKEEFGPDYSRRSFEPEGGVLTKEYFMQGSSHGAFVSGLRISGERFGITDRTIEGTIRRHNLFR